MSEVWAGASIVIELGEYSVGPKLVVHICDAIRIPKQEEILLDYMSWLWTVQLHRIPEKPNSVSFKPERLQ